MQKFSEIHLCGTVCFIGNRANDHKRYLILTADLSDRSAFHLTAKASEFGNDGLFLLCRGNELITGTYTSLEHMDLRSAFFDSIYRTCAHLFIRR